VRELGKDRTMTPEPQDPGASLDALHCDVLRQIASLPEIKSVIEVGSYKGVSTRALFEATGVDWVQLYEIDPLPELIAVVEEFGGCESDIITKPFWEDPQPASLIFIDGDHGEGALKDTLMAVLMEIPVIVMHDSQLKEGWGSRAAVEVLKASGRTWVEDAKPRVGMRTDRGLFVSVNDDKSAGPVAEIIHIFAALP